ncbi:MAG TPA: fructose-6-phosphate aldolase [Actinomycetota bacterium]|nr:fructose-6-phosphate aldolase [Actinomycetota bacterium]
MRLFLDTANFDEIREINRWGVLRGVTTNPSLLAKEHGDVEKAWRLILDEVDGDVSLETTEPEAEAMYAQGVHLAAMAENAVVKVPMTPDGLMAGKRLADEGVRINVTLVFSPAQAILAAEIGAYIVSPFIGRIDDTASDGLYALRQICEIYDVQGYETEVLAASLRHPMHVVEAALAGADIATAPYDVFTKLVRHPLTDKGNAQFLADWAALQKELQEGA